MILAAFLLVLLGVLFDSWAAWATFWLLVSWVLFIQVFS